MDNKNTEKKSKEKTLVEVIKELELKRIQKEKKKIETKMKKDKFIAENKDMVRFCKGCNKELPIDDFVLIFRNKKGTPEFQCKVCKRRKRRNQIIAKATERGY